MAAHDLADAVTALISGEYASDAVTVRRCRLVETELAAVDGILVSVVPFSVVRKIDAVGTQERTTEIRVVVQRKIAGTSTVLNATEEDEAAELAEAIADLLLGVSLLFSECESSERLPSYEAGYLAQFGLFDATIRTMWGASDDGD
jgi:hypothetical protein